VNTTRIIARLDIKGPNLVKGVHLEGLRVMGDPRLFAEQYSSDGIDEMIYIDSVASLYGRNNLTDFVQYAAKKIFVPLTVGGGIRTLEDISNILKVGADKVAINTSAIRNPEFIREAAKKYGSQCIVINIEAKKLSEYRYECFTDNARERTGIDVFKWCEHVESLGAGDILLTSVDFEGTGKGFDLQLTKLVSESVSIPVIACGGCGNLSHISQVIIEGKADAVALASVLHYNKLKKLIQECATKEYLEGNINYLKDYFKGDSMGRRNIIPLSIKEIKANLSEKKIFCRTFEI